nr:hypothetical protein [Tanacetum cinerariifolium]
MFISEAAKFVGDFKSLAKEADESLAKHKALELEIERLLRAVVSQDIMSVVQNNSVDETSNLQTKVERTKERFENCIIKKENEYAKLWNDWYKKCEECKFDKISYDKAYNDMHQKIKRLHAQLGDLKGKSKDTSCISDTLNPLSQKLENENVSDQKDTACGTSTNTKFAKQSILGKSPKACESHALSKPVTSNSTPTPYGSKVMKNVKVIAPGMFRINPFKPSREEKHVPNKVRASVRINPITVSQPPVITKKVVNSDSNGLSSTGVDNTKTRRPQPRSNTKNDRVPSASKTIATACFTQNRSIIHRRFNKTPYELINGKKPDISFLHVFGALCYPKNDREDIGKLGAKGDIDFFIGYSVDSCAFRVYNRRTKKIIETMNVTFDELSIMDFEQRSSKPRLQSMTSRHISSGLDLTYAPSTITTQQPTEVADNVPNAMFDANMFANPFATPSTRAAESSSSQYVDPSNMHTFYQPYPYEFQWTKDHPLEQVIEEPSRPVLTRNQLRSDGDMCMYALTVITMEQKNVKEAMTDPTWIESMQEELLQFKRLDGTTDPTLFIRRFVDDILVVQVYVDDIIFGSTHPRMESCDPVGTPMEIKDKLDLDQNGTPVDATKYRSMIGALMYLTSSTPDIVHATCLCARYQANPIQKHLKEAKRIFCYLRGTINTGLWYTKDSGFELTGFSDADYAGCKDTFKSTFEAEYVSLSACCAQVLWMWTQLTKYGFHFNNIPIYCDSKSTIAISCNPVQHSRTKHITVRYHFIKEHVEKGMIELYFVKTDYQLADLLTKALPVDRFNYLVRRLDMRSLSPQKLDRLAKS